MQNYEKAEADNLDNLTKEDINKKVLSLFEKESEFVFSL